MIKSKAADLNSSLAPTPVFVLRNRQRKITFQTQWIKHVVQQALPQCLAAALPDSPLESLTSIEASIISDKKIASIHNVFFQDPTPTDVITFDHGEILIGADTVSSQAPQFSHTPSAEAALCIIHGILHLGGWKDKTKIEALQMAHRQNDIFHSAAANAQQA